MKTFDNSDKIYVVREGAGQDLSGINMSNMEVYVEDYAENIWGPDWFSQTGIPAIAGCVIRMLNLAQENPDYVYLHRGFNSDIAVYTHDLDGLGHVVYLAELIDPDTGECAYDQEGW